MKTIEMRVGMSVYWATVGEDHAGGWMVRWTQDGIEMAAHADSMFDAWVHAKEMSRVIEAVSR
jgi:hypothetical protein